MKRFLRKHWPLLGLLLLLAVVGFYFVKSGTKLMKAPALFRDIVSGEGLKLKDIHYTQDDPDDRVKWVLDAEEVSFTSDRKTVRFKDFILNVQTEDKNGFKLKGNSGQYSEDTGRIELWGNLDGSSKDGFRVLTEYVMINEKKGFLRSDKAVKISGPDFNIHGTGFHGDLNGRRFEVLSDVTTIIEEEAVGL